MPTIAPEERQRLGPPPYERLPVGGRTARLERLQSLLGRDIVSEKSLAQRVHLKNDIEKILSSIKSGTQGDRVLSAQVLDQLTPPLPRVPDLLNEIAGQDPYVRWVILRSAVRSLSHAPAREAARVSEAIGPIVLNLLLDEDPWIRQEALTLTQRFAEVNLHFKSMLDSLRGTSPETAQAVGALFNIPRNFDNLDQLVVAATRSLTAKEELLRRAALPDNEGGFSIFQIDPVSKLQRFANGKCELPIQKLLDPLEGLSFGSIRKNQDVCNAINAATRTIKNKVMCCSCDQSADVRCLPDKRTQSGLFYFDHGKKAESRFHGGTSVLPRLLAIQSFPNTSQSHG